MSETVSCASCGRLVAREDSFCPGCGASMSEADTATGQHVPPTQDGPTQCVQCGATMGRDDRFCRSCGASRPEDATVLSHVSLRNAQAAQLISATEGEFEILERIGHGAMGAVYVAKDVALGRQVAIKVIAPHLLADPSMVSRFKLEAQTVASLRHPNIVNIHGVREADELHYFVMEYIDGPTLRALVKQHAPLDFEVVRNVLYQVGSALNYAHQAGRGVIHRDIKPANIMLNREGDSFLTDFGISKITEVKTGLTQTGATIGTPEYMSPEQCRGEELTGASDQYALGIVAYEMICGATPFSGTQYSVMVAHAQEPPEPIRSSRPDCPLEIAEVVERMLSKAPAERWPDLDAAVEAMGGRPMGFKDPIRSRIVGLVHATQAAAEGEGTVPASEAPTQVTARPESHAPVSTPSTPATAIDPQTTGAGGEPRPAGAGTAARAAPPEAVAASAAPSPRPRGGSKRGVAGLLAVAALAIAFFGGRALLGGAGAAPGADDAVGGSVSGQDVSAADTTLVAATDGLPSAPEEGGEGEGGGSTDGPVSGDATVPEAADRPPEDPPAEERPRPSNPTPTVPVPASIAVDLSEETVPVGERRPARATVRAADGRALPRSPVRWLSRAPGTVGVDADGILTAFAEGRAWIVASTGRLVDSVQVSARAEVAEIRVEPGQATLEAGQSRRLVARALGPGGSELQRDLEWTTSDPAVVTVDPSGEARAVGPGAAVVTASSEGVEGGVSIQVEASALSPPTEAELTTQVDRYLQLMVEDRAAAMALWPEETGDEDLREDLDQLLGRDDLTAAVQEPATSSMAGDRAIATFVAAVTHRGNFGRDREGTVTFRMELAPSGSAWRVVAVRAESFDGF